MSTVFPLIACAILASFTALCAWVAGKRAEQADERATELEQGIRQLKALHLDVAALEMRVNRVTGRVYAQARYGKKRATEQPDETDDSTEEELDPDFAAQLALQRTPDRRPG